MRTIEEIKADILENHNSEYANRFERDYSLKTEFLYSVTDEIPLIALKKSVIQNVMGCWWCCPVRLV